MFNLPKFKPFYTQKITPVGAEFTDIRGRAFRDHEFFIRTFFSGDRPGQGKFWGELSDMHRDFCEIEREPDTRGVKRVIAAPRGNAKSTFRTLFKVIHAIVYDYHKFIVILGWSADEAEKKVQEVREELDSNEKLIQVYGRMLPARVGQYEFTTLNGIRVVARGRGGQVRGLKHRGSRPTLVIMDDVESLESTRTPEQRKKTHEWLTKDVIGCGAPDGSTNFEWVGTILHEDAELPHLLKNPGWRYRKKYKAVLSFAKRQDLWDRWKGIYQDLDNPSAQEDALAFFENNKDAMLEGVRVLWPDGEPYYKLMEFIVQNGQAAFNSEKQNEPFDPDAQLLNPDAAARFHVYRPGDPEWPKSLGDDGFALVRGDTGKAIHSKDLNVIGFLDPALGKKPKGGKASDPDYAALVVCAQDLSGYIYVLDAWLKKKPPDTQIAAAFELNEKWGMDRLYLETVGFQELLKPLFKEEQKSQSQSLKIVGVGQHHNKQARISTLQPYFSNGWILFNDVVDPELINQIRLFPTVHDDGPDALHGCVSRLRKPRGAIQTLKSSEDNGVS